MSKKQRDSHKKRRQKRAAHNRMIKVMVPLIDNYFVNHFRKRLDAIKNYKPGDYYKPIPVPFVADAPKPSEEEKTRLKIVWGYQLDWETP